MFDEAENGEEPKRRELRQRISVLMKVMIFPLRKVRTNLEVFGCFNHESREVIIA